MRFSSFFYAIVLVLSSSSVYGMDGCRPLSATKSTERQSLEPNPTRRAFREFVKAVDFASLESTFAALVRTDFSSEGDRFLRHVAATYDFTQVFIRLRLSEEQNTSFLKNLASHDRRLPDYQKGVRKLCWALIEKLKVARDQLKMDEFLTQQMKMPSIYSAGFIQWMAWEALANAERHQQPIGWVPLEATEVSSELVQIETVDGVRLSGKMNHLFETDDQKHISWPHHPFNTLATTPFKSPSFAVNGSLDFHFTASRSMVLRGTTYSFKLPTDNPTRGENNPSKADMVNSVKLAMDRGNLIRRIDDELGEDSKLVILYDVASFIEKASGNGFTVRDVSIFNNGNYWLPSSSINIVGAKIAKSKTMSASRPFWIEHYVKLIARAKALLLLRYGLQMKYPHLQNSVTEYSADLKPLDRIAIRDITDTVFIRKIAEIVAPEELKSDLANGYQVNESLSPIFGNNSPLDPFRQNSVGALHPAIVLGVETPSFSNSEDSEMFHQEKLRELEKIEADYFISVVREELGIAQTFDAVWKLNDYLLSNAGLNAIRAYHAKQSHGRVGRRHSPLQ